VAGFDAGAAVAPQADKAARDCPNQPIPPMAATKNSHLVKRAFIAHLPVFQMSLLNYHTAAGPKLEPQGYSRSRYTDPAALIVRREGARA
jgi:hypothetical protein